MLVAPPRVDRDDSMRNDLSGLRCQNADCPDHQKPGKNSLRVESRYGKNRELRLLVCRTCGQRFSERKGTPLFKAQLPDAKINLLINYLGNGKGVREIARIVGVNRNTVVRYSRLLGRSPSGSPTDPQSLDTARAKPSGVDTKQRRGPKID
jgi:transposase-like protein